MPLTNEWNLKIAKLRTAFLLRVRRNLTSQQCSKLDQLQIVFNPRLRTTIGRACYKGNWIELNPHLITRYPKQLEPTLAHELAHMVAPMIYGRQGLGHQIGWKKVMSLFGYSPERTHCLDVGPLLRRHSVVAIAECGCEGYRHSIKPRRYYKMVARKISYKCVKCNKRLKIKRVTQNETK